MQSIGELNRTGYLSSTTWIRRDADPQWSRGEAMFRGQCGACHTIDGYRSLRVLLAGRNRASIQNFLSMLHEYKPDSPYRKFMPPLTGTQEEIQSLGVFLASRVVPPRTALAARH